MMLWRRMQQDIHMRTNMHMAQLQRACQCKDKRYVLLLRDLLADDLDVGGRPRGQTARQGRVAVDVELEEMEEGVVDEGDGAIDLALGAVSEF